MTGMSVTIITLEDILESKIIARTPLHGGDTSDVSHIRTLDGRDLVVKQATSENDLLNIEGAMLRYLAENTSLPVPKVHYTKRGYLIMDYIPHAGKRDHLKAAVSTAEHIVNLHKVRPFAPKPLFGFENDTIIGRLPQKNGWSENWTGFFGEKRLNAMKELAVAEGTLPSDFAKRIDIIIKRLPDLIPTRIKSSMLHGDLWSGNILIDGGQVAAFIDPAISYGHREMDLAFMDLMGGMGQSFFDAYNTLFPVRKGFWKSRRYIYQLWPLLVHVKLFGSSYLPSLNRTLKQLGH